MQTFVPYADFAKSVATIDMQRLGKQRVETLQIMKALTNPFYGWQNHPAVNMWRGYELALLKYQEATVAEWIPRPRKSGKSSPDTCLQSTADVFFEWQGSDDMSGLVLPPWVGREDVHESHRSRLMTKDPQYYVPQFADNTRPGLEYVWPV